MMRTLSLPRIKILAAMFVLIVLLPVGPAAQASLILNATGIADGFSVSDFATGLPNTGGQYGQGPFGITVVPNGSGGSNVLLEDYYNSSLYVFNNSDGQTPSSALVTVPGFQAYAEGFATLNGVAYGANGSTYGSFSSIGAFTPLNIPGLPGPYYGMAADQATGELIARSSIGLIAINPTTNSYRLINNAMPDGVSVSPDGKTAYVAIGSNVVGYDVVSGAQVFTGPTPGVSYAPDGTGVISSNNSLNGDIISNDNYGNVYLIDPNAYTIDLIGTNSGQRGDFTTPDFTNGTLLMDYSSQVERLSCGVGCGIGSTPPPSNNVPEPDTLLIFGSGLAALLGLSRRRRSRHVTPI